MVSISYAITVCDEYVEIQRLVEFLLKHKQDNDEIVILWDTSKNCTAVEEYLRSHCVNNEYYWISDKFEGDFSNWKNTLNKFCIKDFIFQIDADELPTEALMEALPVILEDNNVDCYAVPRWNVVKGITPEHVSKWGWKLDYKERINWPDYQLRIYRNTPDIKWEGKVHERPIGYKTISAFPSEIDYLCLQHIKTIEKQVQQNSFYEQL